MSIPWWMWTATVAGFVIIVAADLIFVDSRPHVVKIKEAAIWASVYIALAVIFGIVLWIFEGHQYGAEFFAGYITEKALSVDNLFLFLIIMTSFRVPAEAQHRLLMLGIVMALVMRAIFIAIGAAAIARFAATFFVFGGFLLYTAIKVGTSKEGNEKDPHDWKIVRWISRVFPMSPKYNGNKIFGRDGGKRVATPLFIALIAIGFTDLLFALDSIPAVFGLTKEPYIVLTANAFALLGLSQLYFVLGGVLSRLVYLNVGLSIILAFIGVKLILEAMHEALHWHVPEIPILGSIGFIVVVLAITTVASLMKSRSMKKNGVLPAAEKAPEAS